jgi:hypothetical protein
LPAFDASPKRRASRRGVSYPSFIKNVGALAMGSVTYEWMLKHVVGPEAKRPVKAVGTGFAELHYEVPRPSFKLAE